MARRAIRAAIVVGIGGLALFTPDGAAVVLMDGDGTLRGYDWPLALPWGKIALGFLIGSGTVLAAQRLIAGRRTEKNSDHPGRHE